MKITHPTLHRIFSTNYINPTTDEGSKVYFKKEGKFVNRTGDIVEGTYYTYKNDAWPNKYVSVFVSSMVNEDGEEKEMVDVVSIETTSKKAIKKNKYRIAAARKFERSKMEESLVKEAKPSKAQLDKSVKLARLYIGSEGKVRIKDQQKIYDQLKKSVESIVKKTGIDYNAAHEQIMKQANKLGKITPQPGRDI